MRPSAQAPGRFNVLRDGDSAVIVDYAHNPSALRALVEALERFPHRRRTLVFTGCNRRDELTDVTMSFDHAPCSCDAT